MISGALLFIGKDFHGLTSTNKGMLTSILLIGAVIGALYAGKIGRRRTVLGTAAVFVLAVQLAALSPSYDMLLVARVVIGLAVGSASMVVPLYIGEAAPPRIRGALVSFNQLTITSGTLASYLVGYCLASTQSWRLMFALAAIPAVLVFVGMWFQHESPHWLVTQGRRDGARAVLERVGDDSYIDAEIAQVRELSKRKFTARDLLNPRIRHTLTSVSPWRCSSSSLASTRSSTARRRCCPQPASVTPRRCWPTSSTAASTLA